MDIRCYNQRMFRTRQWQKWMAWVACAALLAAALLPSVSHAIAFDRVAAAMAAEICAPSGKSYTDQQSPSKHAGHMEDCPYCRSGGDVPVLPGVQLVPAPIKIAALKPALFYVSPAPMFMWAAAQPRGPPSLA